MIVSSVLFVAGAHAAARVRFNNQLDHATVEQYGAEHLGAIDISKFLMSWNATMGPPPRGWYKAEFFMDNKQNNNEIIKKSGDDGQTKSCKHIYINNILVVYTCKKGSKFKFIILPKTFCF